MKYIVPSCMDRYTNQIHVYIYILTRPKILNNSAKFMVQGWEIDQFKKQRPNINLVFIRAFIFIVKMCLNTVDENYPQNSNNIHNKNVSLFPTTVTEFKMSRLTLPLRKIVIEFMMKQ